MNNIFMENMGHISFQIQIHIKMCMQKCTWVRKDAHWLCLSVTSAKHTVALGGSFIIYFGIDLYYFISTLKNLQQA